MKRFFIFCLIIILAPVSLFAQSGRKQVEEGNKLYAEDKFDAANDKYRDALNEDPLYIDTLVELITGAAAKWLPEPTTT